MNNRFAEKRRRYLRTHMDGIYTGMLLTGTLEPHLAEIGESAQAMFDRLVEQMKKAEGVTEQLKAEIQHFFERYKDLEPGKWVKGEGWEDLAAAEKMVQEAIDRFAAEGH